jgi:hypothetical protein
MEAAMKKYLLFLFLLFSQAFTYNSLQVSSPLQWKSANATISDATLSVRPVGLYMEYGLYLTISAPVANFSPTDPLEIVFQFDLDPQAIMHDLWLWVDNQIMRGLIMDRWRASNIYEGIVNRRRDPAILFKESSTQYLLRVYPVLAGSSRRIKLTWLQPTNWTNHAVSASLPTSMLRISQPALSQLKLLQWPEKCWWSPQIPELSSLHFKTSVDSSGRSYNMAVINGADLQKNLSIRVDAPLRRGVFFSRLEGLNDGYYQLAFLPDLALPSVRNRKLAFLLDYDAARATQSADEWIKEIKNQLKWYMVAGDSFNIIVSQLAIRRASQKWLPVDTSSIEQAFRSFGPVPLAGYSNLPSLLMNGVDFVKANGKVGQLVLIGNADQHGDYRVANPLIKDLLAMMNPVIPIHVADITTSNVNFYNFNGRTYRGNEYLYLNLTQQTQGQYQTIAASGSLAQTLAPILANPDAVDQAFDFYSAMENGFCYDRHTIYPTSGRFSLNQPILQIGRYRGQPPFVLQSSGMMGKTAFTHRLQISDQDMFAPDSLMEEMWTGLEINRMESGNGSNATINQIIDLSMAQRVLSRYTAFLALEPSNTVPVCTQCQDESKAFTAVEKNEEEARSDSLIQIFPNPFNERTVIKVCLKTSQRNDNVSVRIFNLLGQQVREFTPPPGLMNSDWNVYWDGRDETGRPVSSGTFLVVATQGQKRQTVKVQYLK